MALGKRLADGQGTLAGNLVPLMVLLLPFEIQARIP